MSELPFFLKKFLLHSPYTQNYFSENLYNFSFSLLKICNYIEVHYICKYKKVSMNSSESILNLFKKDENGAFQQLFNRYYDNLLLYCYHISGNLEAAEDIVQDCFTNL